MTPHRLRFSITGAAVILLSSTIHDISGQRPLWPIGEFDMSMYDVAELCHQIDVDKANGTDTSSAEEYLPPIGNCFFFQWIFCPNVKENVESPCGWWVQKPCNITERRVGHDNLKDANPPGVDPEDVDGDSDHLPGAAAEAQQNNEPTDTDDSRRRRRRLSSIYNANKTQNSKRSIGNNEWRFEFMKKLFSYPRV